ncbi:MAG: 30S ribosomal protein S2 [Candidatus Aenigmarchaeota archaeon]|nr:30S ribosomal protein S2 [Candidatus Aenigmarchaeota archaeon]
MAEKKDEDLQPDVQLYLPREMYLTSGAHIGMTHKTKDMMRFVYKVRPNGLAVLNIGELDKRIQKAAQMLASAKNPVVVCRKEIAWEPCTKFGEITGIKVHLGRFMPGSLTNPSYKGFFEADLLLAADPTADAQAIKEAVNARIPVIALADTSYSASYIDLVIPCNNKGRKALSLVFWGLAKKFLELKGEKAGIRAEDFGWEREESVKEKEDEE